MNRTHILVLVVVTGVSLGAGAGEDNAFIEMSAHCEAIGNPYAPYMLLCGDVIQK